MLRRSLMKCGIAVSEIPGPSMKSTDRVINTFHAHEHTVIDMLQAKIDVMSDK
jgi:hypothetical protein